MSKRTGWILVAIAFVALLAVTYVATRHSQRVDAVQTNNMVASGTAYDATTGNTVAAAAQPGAVGGGAEKTVTPVVVQAPAAGS